jgi:membrane-associated protease RseP (regulator of RpoE activity)
VNLSQYPAGPPPDPQLPRVTPGSTGIPWPAEPYSFAVTRPVEHRWWLHILLLLLTLVTTTVVGAGFEEGFRQGRPFNFERDLGGYLLLFDDPKQLLSGLPFSLTLLLVLLAHEMGHYFFCRFYRVDATLPYFLPAPTLIGTFGAFIRIRSAILSRRVLFDIGIGGPLLGFLMLLPFLIAGVSMSRVLPGIGTRGDVVFGTPILQRLVEMVFFPGVASQDILLHPIARASWVGLMATALNLLPIGSLDGGHILYAFFGDRMRILSRIFTAALIPLGLFFSYSWLVWAALLLLLGLRHPRIYDNQPVGRMRAVLAILAMLIFLASFTVAPISTGEL